MKSPSLKALFSLIGLCSIVLASNIANATIDKTYSLKAPPATGTNIQTVIAKSRVSFSKSFDNLSDREQEIFKSQFLDIGSNDSPPFPAYGLRTIYKPIVKANQNIQAKGSLHLTANVNAKGFVESIEVLSNPDEKLTAIAQKVLLSTRFDPASCDGVACEMSFPLEIDLQ
ncbi:MAG: hypothetical protein MK188_14485 [Gammaproteobacteria bacterium]|nr:hypothetical protein [Gammaproteobacteria bacterium]